MSVTIVCLPVFKINTTHYVERGEFFQCFPPELAIKKSVSAIFHRIQVTTPPRSSRKHTVRQFIEFVVVETKRFIGSNVNVILTR